MAIETLVELLEEYNKCFYDRDAERLRTLCFEEPGGFTYFDNHADCDSYSLGDHVEKVAAFLERDAIEHLEVEPQAGWMSEGAGCLTGIVRYSSLPDSPVRFSMFAARSNQNWKIRHLHFSASPMGTPGSQDEEPS